MNLNGELFHHEVKEDTRWYTPGTYQLGKVEIRNGETGVIKVVANYSYKHSLANLMELRLVPVE